MSRFIDLSVTVDENTFSPPSTNMKLEVTPHRRGPGFWQVSSVNQSLHTGAHIDSPLHVFKNGITTAEITLDQVMGEALVVDLSWVGANHAITIDDLKKGGAGDIMHVTRMTPKRADELLSGGSLYWVIKGQIAARQKLLDLKPVQKEGKTHCALVYDPKLIPVMRRSHRPFQGWRYLDPKDAPPDVKDIKAGNLPEKLKQELAELGLL